MCLAVPGRIVSKEEGVGIVDIRGNRLRAGLALVPEAEVGDWVLVHAGLRHHQGHAAGRRRDQPPPGRDGRTRRHRLM